VHEGSTNFAHNKIFERGKGIVQESDICTAARRLQRDI